MNDPSSDSARPTAAELARLGGSPGLCGRCRHARVLTSKTSAFLRCGRSDTDARYPRYPSLPVERCAGWDP